jgi:NAD(P)-dependent dehydrogenase (short-subunit alcohol dehydrogenase family)
VADRLAGRVALVTGAASGIGAACVARFAEEYGEALTVDGGLTAGRRLLSPDAQP